MKLIRTTFQDCDYDSSGTCIPKLVLVVDMEDDMGLVTSQISDLVEKMETGLPGIFPDEDSPLAHHCGGKESGIPIHSFREEIEHGTNIPHLLEHVILFLMSKRSKHCSAFCGQRSIDIEQGILTHYYLILDYPSKLEAVVAVDLAVQLVTAWMGGKTVVIDADVMLAGVQERLEPMVSPLLPLSETALLVS